MTEKILQSSLDTIPTCEVLLCPVCGFECIHPLRVKVAKGDSVTLVDAEETRVVKGDTAESRKARSERGARIILEYLCESGHHGNIIFQFHKGNVFVEHEVLEPPSEWNTLWRS